MRCVGGSKEVRTGLVTDSQVLYDGHSLARSAPFKCPLQTTVRMNTGHNFCFAQKAEQNGGSAAASQSTSGWLPTVEERLLRTGSCYALRTACFVCCTRTHSDVLL